MLTDRKCNGCCTCQQEPKYKVGQRVFYGVNEYIIANVDGESFGAISLRNGNRWREPTSLEVLIKELDESGFTTRP